MSSTVTPSDNHSLTSIVTLLRDATPQLSGEVGPNVPASDLFSDSAEFLRQQDIKYFTSIAPTLCYILLLMLLGLFGNTVVFLVYYRRFKHSSTRYFILAMSVCDLVINMTSLSDVFELRYHNTFDAAWVCKLTRTIKSFFSAMSAAVLVAIAMDRYRKVCRPHSKPPTSKQLRITLGVWAVIAFCTTIPYTVINGRRTVHYPGTNITGCKCSTEDVYVNSLFLKVFNGCREFVFGVCLLIMIVSYARIAWRLKHKQSAWVRVTGRACEQRERVTRSNVKEVELRSPTDKGTSNEGQALKVSSRPLQDLSNSGESSGLKSSTESRSATEPSGTLNSADLQSPSRDNKLETYISNKPQEIIVDDSKEQTAKGVGLTDSIYLEETSPTIMASETSVRLSRTRRQSWPSTVRGSGLPDLNDRFYLEETSPTIMASETSVRISRATRQSGATIRGSLPDLTDRFYLEETSPTVMASETSVRLSRATRQSGIAVRGCLHDLTDRFYLEETSPTVMASDTSVRLSRVTRKNCATEPPLRTVHDQPRNALTKQRSTDKRKEGSHGNPKNHGRKQKKESLLGRLGLSRRRRNTTASSGSVRKISTRTTLMMFILTVIFIVNYLPFLVVVSLRARSESIQEELDLNMYHIFIRSFFINSVINPLVYGFCSVRFRMECRRLFNCKTFWKRN